MSNTLRAAASVGLVVVVSVVLVVYRTAERAQDSNQWVMHTQEVLTAIETVLSTLVGAETTANSYLAAAWTRAPEPLDHAARSVHLSATRSSISRTSASFVDEVSGDFTVRAAMVSRWEV
jgi:hypothetical protein